MDELAVAMKAREFIRLCGPPALPVSVDAHAEKIGGVVQTEKLEENEDAWSFRDKDGKYRICVNCAHNSRRQRFSACHEVAQKSPPTTPIPVGITLVARPAKSLATYSPLSCCCPISCLSPASTLLTWDSLQSLPWPTSSTRPLSPLVRASPPSPANCAHSPSPKAARFATAHARPSFATRRLGSDRAHRCPPTPTAPVFAPGEIHQVQKKPNRWNGLKAGTAMDRSAKTPCTSDNGTRR
jgi:hypothetical protein